MRKTIDPQMKLEQVDISEIEFDLRSRDEIPKLLMGLQYIRQGLNIGLGGSEPPTPRPQSGCPPVS